MNTTHIASAQHTPGPWHWNMGDKHGDAMPILMSSVGYVCDFGNDRQYYPTAGNAPSEADARLIAAAPDLLAALRLFNNNASIKCAASGVYTIAVNGRDLIQMREAIAAATGNAA